MEKFPFRIRGGTGHFFHPKHFLPKYAVSRVSTCHHNWTNVSPSILLSLNVCRKAEDAPVRGDNPNEIVHAFVYGGGGDCISLSPFSVKLLMYLRLAGIPHDVSFADPNKAPKSKVPYIQHGEVLLGDSQLIIRYLENTYNVKKMAGGVADRYTLDHAFLPFEQLSLTQQSKSDLVRLTCESDLYWATVSIRWGGESGMAQSESHWDKTVSHYFEAIPVIIRPLLVRLIRSGVFRDAWGQGFTRHSPGDQLFLAKRAVMAVSVLLGTNPFFLGKHPTECDCIAYGTVSQLLEDTIWPNELAKFVRTECPNLVEFSERIRSSIFHDVQPGQKFPDGVLGTKVYALLQ